MYYRESKIINNKSEILNIKSQILNNKNREPNHNYYSLELHRPFNLD